MQSSTSPHSDSLEQQIQPSVAPPGNSNTAYHTTTPQMQPSLIGDMNMDYPTMRDYEVTHAGYQGFQEMGQGYNQEYYHEYAENLNYDFYSQQLDYTDTQAEYDDRHRWTTSNSFIEAL